MARMFPRSHTNPYIIRAERFVIVLSDQKTDTHFDESRHGDHYLAFACPPRGEEVRSSGYGERTCGRVKRERRAACQLHRLEISEIFMAFRSLDSLQATVIREQDADEMQMLQVNRSDDLRSLTGFQSYLGFRRI